MIILDTDHVTLLQWGGRQANNIIRRLQQAGLTSPATTIISYEEHVRGWMAKISSARTLDDEVRVYAKLKSHIVFYNEMDVTEFDQPAATQFQNLQRQRIRIGTMDLKIAAIALISDAVLFTKNAVDFGKVPGLRFVDGSA